MGLVDMVLLTAEATGHLEGTVEVDMEVQLDIPQSTGFNLCGMYTCGLLCATVDSYVMWVLRRRPAATYGYVLS